MKIKLQGTKNTRDFSEYGYKNYIRSAHLNELTNDDMDILLRTHHLKTIIDLRTTQEVKEKPDVKLPDVAYFHIPLFDEVMPGISHEEETDELKSMIPDMQELYRCLVTEEEYVAKIKEAMRIITDPDRKGAILWHCTEGKDRCGIISALFLFSHDISRKKIMADYLKTNRCNFLKAWKYFILVFLSRKDFKLAKSVKNAFLAKKEYMAPIFDILDTLSKTDFQA